LSRNANQANFKKIPEKTLSRMEKYLETNLTKKLFLRVTSLWLKLGIPPAGISPHEEKEKLLMPLLILSTFLDTDAMMSEIT